MKDEYLREKQLVFLTRFDQSRITQIHNLLEHFYQAYPIRVISRLERESYVYGRHQLDQQPTFCYWMEKTLSSFGRIAGSPCSQYGVWFGTHGKDKNVIYRHTKKYGISFDAAFAQIKQEIVSLLDAGRRKDYSYIAKCKIASKFKGKILATYYPDDYLSVYAEDYLDDILRYFNLDDQQSKRLPAIEKQRLLINWRDHDPYMQHWSLMKFAMFLNDELYTYYYEKTAVKQEEDRVPQFPDLADIDPQFVSYAYDEDRDVNATSDKPKKTKRGKIDPLKKTLRDKAIGDRGEQIVKLAEQKRLNNAGRPDLASKVDWVSKREDGHGYDILSWETNEEPRHIEVKATSTKQGDARFYLTQHEFDLSKGLKNYYIYYVYDVTSQTPRIWPLANPFHPLQQGIVLDTAVYKVTVFKKK